MHPLGPSADFLAAVDNAAGFWFRAIYPFAVDLFWSLATLQILWLAIQAVLGGISQSLWDELVWLGLRLVLFAIILANIDTLAPAVVNMFVDAGKAGSTLTSLDPPAVFGQGVALTKSLLFPLGVTGTILAPVTAIASAIAALIIFLAFIYLSAVLLGTLVEASLVMSGGVVLLGFLGSSMTRGISEKFFSFLISIGTHLLFLYLIIGLGNLQVAHWLALMQARSVDLDIVLNIGGGALLYLYLAVHVPSAAAALLTGAINISAHEMQRTSDMVPSVESRGTNRDDNRNDFREREKQGFLARSTPWQATKGAMGMTSRSIKDAIKARFRGSNP